MEVTRNGRLTEHTVMLDVKKAPTITLTKGRSAKVWPFRITIKMQYLWSDGAWHLREARVTGYQNARLRGEPCTITFKNPETVPDWIKDLLTEHTPNVLAAPEMVRQVQVAVRETTS